MSIRAKSTPHGAQHRARTREPKLKRRRIMPSRTWRASFLAGSVLAGVIGVTLTGEAAAQQKASPPDFLSEPGRVDHDGRRPLTRSRLAEADHLGPSPSLCAEQCWQAADVPHR